MTIRFSVLSKFKTILGVSIERNGKVIKDASDKPAFQSTIDVTFGFVFGYISLEFQMGKAMNIEEMITEFKAGESGLGN